MYSLKFIYMIPGSNEALDVSKIIFLNFEY